jgi:hypothetical protein
MVTVILRLATLSETFTDMDIYLKQFLYQRNSS